MTNGHRHPAGLEIDPEPVADLANSVSVTASCIDNSGGIYQGFYMGVAAIPNITVSGTVSMPLLNGWLLGLNNTLTFTVSHKEVHFGQ